ncbi:MAG TPA: TetR family transcriptional regulator [Burkholderiaceae bacterium]|nr:TetR family transcriptional regulator [Burkholderiaceae bacterium]
MARRTKEEALETREQLLDAAERVFLERGVGHASLAEVADAAGVTRGAIYHHFDSKAELFEAMVERAEMPIDAAFEAAAAPDDDPLDALGKRALSALLQLASSSRVRRVFEVVFLRCEYTDELAAVEQRHLREREQCLYLCGSLLDKAVELGQLPRDTDTRMASQLLYALIGGLMRDWVQAPKSFDLKAVAPQLINLFMAGLRAAPPARSAQKSGL